MTRAVGPPATLPEQQLPNQLPTSAKRRPEWRRISLARAMGREGLEPSTYGL